jgi:hypothetical protein
VDKGAFDGDGTQNKKCESGGSIEHEDPDQLMNSRERRGMEKLR